MLQTTLETAFNTVKKLVEDFDASKDYYLASTYSEQSARHDFIDKFFIALGWDVNHESDKNPYEQEAHIESNVNAQGKRKRADYAFYVAPNFRDVVFYAEAKKPSVQIENADDYFQTIRYGYSSKTPLAVLTDFEQFHVLDCRYAPSIETALVRFVKKYNYKDYLDKDKFAEIYYLFSREAVAGGSIEKRTLELPKARGGAVQLGLFKGGYKPIDEALLDELDEYRDTLAHAFKNGNPELDHWALTEIVQRTIDRLVFIRFLEDKLIEPEDIISNFGAKSDSVWKDFVSTCRKLDKVYNGTIYKKHGILDAPDFKFDENVFADICEKLSGKNTPYDFDKIPIHILGSIYERFLGKIITATAKRADVEERPKVKKASGVFYTPEYIVRYILENTVEKMINGKTLEEIAKMRFADIACGSGSFLLGAFDCLLRYYANYYNKNPKEARARDCVTRGGALHLTLHKKREILLNNIYGVDIDQQAVEVSQLSLYLKLLENETLESTNISIKADGNETVLPSLVKNIQCGNSLIGSDFEAAKDMQVDLFGRVSKREINAFDWDVGFPEIIRNGGFDAIFGNPPYVRPHNLKNEIKKALWARYTTYVAKSDLYCCFVEKGLSLTKVNGLFSYIVPVAWISLESFTNLRRYFLDNSTVVMLTQLPKKVFQEAIIETCIFLVRKRSRPKTKPEINQVAVANLAPGKPYQKVRVFPQEDIENAHLFNFQLYGTSGSQQITNKMKKIGKNLGVYVNFVYGFKTGDDPKFIFLTRKNLDCKSFIRSAAISRYYHEAPTEYVWYVPEKMTRNKSTARPGDAARFQAEKILVSRMGSKELVASYDSGGLYVKDAMLLLARDNEHSLKYLLGLINSHLMSYFYREFFITIDVLKNALLSLPIRPIDHDKTEDKARHDQIVSHVAAMLDLHKKLPKAKTDFDKNSLSRQIESADRRIDELVYELYGLTAEEIKIVEESTKN